MKGNMNDPEYQEMLETSWRRKLTSEEKARLEALLALRPEARAGWQTDAALTGGLRRLPEPVLASNFTSQVMRAIRAEQGPPEPAAAGWLDWLGRFRLKVAWAAVAVVLGTVAFQGYGHLKRARIAQALASIPVVSEVPAPEILQDFDAIQQFSHVAAAPSETQTISDEALLAALQ
jgi:anti-sigma factor RsiW